MRKSMARMKEEAIERGRKEGLTGHRVAVRERGGKKPVRVHRRKRYGGSGSGRRKLTYATVDDQIYRGLMRLALTCRTTKKRRYYRDKLNRWRGSTPRRSGRSSASWRSRRRSPSVVAGNGSSSGSRNRWPRVGRSGAAPGTGRWSARTTDWRRASYASGWLHARPLLRLRGMSRVGTVLCRNGLDLQEHRKAGGLASKPRRRKRPMPDTLREARPKDGASRETRRANRLAAH